MIPLQRIKLHRLSYFGIRNCVFKLNFRWKSNKEIKDLETEDAMQQRKTRRDLFYEREKYWDSLVSEDTLTPEELIIHHQHKDMCMVSILSLFCGGF